jgi:1-acyl-sn-glycerol-3-phosphate acyltransferase
VQRLWYYFLRLYVKVGLRFYFKNIVIHGDENIPVGPVIFAANHQNAFMDALMIVCFNSHFTHFLARADIFKKPFTRWLLTTLNMVPIYRIRDGWQSLSENQKTFEACSKIFERDDAVVIFPEGNHGGQRRVRPLSKGFSRIAFEALKKNPALKISIVPVGLNYSDHQKFRGSVSVYFGQPVLVSKYFDEPVPTGANRLRDDISFSLRQLTTHIESIDQYDSIIRKLKSSHADFLNPVDTNSRVSKIEKGEEVAGISQPIKSAYRLRSFHYLALIINFIPLLFWHKIRNGIKDPVFITSLKFGVGIFAFPGFYLIIATLISIFGNSPIVVVWLAISFPSMLFYRNPPPE